jgi:UDP-N-acetylglucosamine:LPS N-acetylglucosamine transferase
LEDIPDRPFGFLVPNRRDFAKSRYAFIGYILPFLPDVFADQGQLRAEFGYGQGPPIICSIGGTSVGKELLELCAAAWPELQSRLPSAQLVLVCGPRVDPATLSPPDCVRVQGYVPGLYRHFAACDLAIVQGGGTTTLELTALRQPFLYFPLEGHCEQEGDVCRRLIRHGAGERMTLSKTTPHELADRALACLNRKATWAEIPTDGARRGAQAIVNLMGRRAVNQP